MAFTQEDLTTTIEAAIKATLEARSDMGNTPTINAVAPKLPQFNSLDPDLWFALVESEFEHRKVTDPATKYSYTLAALDSTTVSLVGDIAFMSPASKQDRNELLKSRIRKALGISNDTRAERVIDYPALETSEKPALWWGKIKSLAGPDLPLTGRFERLLILRKLPVQYRKLAATKGLEDLESIMTAADTQWEALHSCQDQAGSVAALGLGSRPHVGGFCPYHQEYGFNALRCIPPCSMSQHVATPQGKEKKGKKNKRKNQNTEVAALAITHEVPSFGERAGEDLAGLQ